jgi:AbrB family looped-hinge helix DNA binding protein
MATDAARVTSKGQVTIPKAVRDRLGLRPGDVIEFSAEPTGTVVRKRRDANPFEQYRGYLKHLAGTTPEDLVSEMRAE